MLLLLCVSSWRARASHGAGSAAMRATTDNDGTSRARQKKRFVLKFSDCKWAQLCFCCLPYAIDAPPKDGLALQAASRALATQDLQSKAHREKNVMAQGRAMPADISLSWRMPCMCQVYVSWRQKKKMKKLCRSNSTFEQKRLSEKSPELLSRAVHCPSP